MSQIYLFLYISLLYLEMWLFVDKASVVVKSAIQNSALLQFCCELISSES